LELDDVVSVDRVVQSLTGAEVVERWATRVEPEAEHGRLRGSVEPARLWVIVVSSHVS
jgi:hypothetical protein